MSLEEIKQFPNVERRRNPGVPAEHREAIERALQVHPEGCPAHQSVKGSIEVTWDATLRLGESVIEVRQATSKETSFTSP